MKNKSNMLLPYIQLFAEDGTQTNSTGDDNGSAADCENKNENESFESLIKGRYKDEFSKKTQEIIDKRFKRTKELESFFENASPVIEKLSGMLGVNSEDYEKMLDSFDEASEKAEENIEEDEDISRVDEIRNGLQKITAEFINESEELKKLYPDFSLKKEIGGNPLFSKLIKNGISVKDAFEFVHKDEIVTGAMAYTANAVKEKMLKGIEQKSVRPIENGIGDKSTAVTKTNVNALTRNDILKILKQVENGAEIRF